MYCIYVTQHLFETGYESIEYFLEILQLKFGEINNK